MPSVLTCFHTFFSENTLSGASHRHDNKCVKLEHHTCQIYFLYLSLCVCVRVCVGYKFIYSDFSQVKQKVINKTANKENNIKHPDAELQSLGIASFFLFYLVALLVIIICL